MVRSGVLGRSSLGSFALAAPTSSGSGGGGGSGSGNGLYVLVGFNNKVLDDITAMGGIAPAGTPGRDGVTRTAPTVGGSFVWTDITQYVLSGDYRVGRQHELSRFEAGEARLEVDNTSGVFSPWNTASPFYGLLNAMTPLQIRRVWNGVTYIEFTGYVYAWPQKWPDQVNATAEIQAADAFRLLSLANISGSVYSAEVLSTNPIAYYRLGDLSTPYALDEVAGHNGTYFGSGVQSVPGALFSDVDNAYDFGNYAGGVNLPAAACPNSAAFTIKGWAKLHGAPSATGNDRLYGASSEGANQTLILYLQQSTGSPTGYAGLYFSASDSVHFTVYRGAGNTGLDEAIPIDGNFHQWACTRDSTGLVYSIYIDGVLKMQTTLANVITLNSLDSAALGATTTNSGSPFTQQLNGELDEVSIHNVALTPAQILADYNAGVGLWSIADIGTRINSVLDTIGWPGNARNVQGGVSATPAVTAALTKTKVLQYLQTLENTEAGALFMGQDGRVTFLNRASIVAAAVTPQLTFGDGGAGEFPFEPGPAQALDDTDIWNESVVSRPGGQSQRSFDQASADSYGTRSMPNRSGLLYTDDTSSQHRSEWDVERYKQPTFRVSSIRVRPAVQPTLVPTLLGLTMMSCVQVHRANLPGSPFLVKALVEGKQVAFNAESGDWTINFSLSPIEARPYWILGDSSFGVLGSTTRLRF